MSGIQDGFKKVWVAERDMFVFDGVKGKTIGTIKKGEYLGELQTKQKDINSDSFWFGFIYPKGKYFAVPNGFAYSGKTFFVLCEPNEIKQTEIKIVGSSGADAIIKTGEAVKDISKFTVKIILSVLLVYVALRVIEKNI